FTTASMWTLGRNSAGTSRGLRARSIGPEVRRWRCDEKGWSKAMRGVGLYTRSRRLSTVSEPPRVPHENRDLGKIARAERTAGRSDYLGLIARVHQIRAREVRDGPGGQLAQGLPLQNHAPAAVPELDGLIDGPLNGAPVSEEKVVGIPAVPLGHLHSCADGEVAFDVRPGVQQPRSADETDVADPPSVHDMAGRVCVEPRLGAVGDGHRQPQTEAIGGGISHVDVDGMNVDDERLAKEACRRRY